MRFVSKYKSKSLPEKCPGVGQRLTIMGLLLLMSLNTWAQNSQSQPLLSSDLATRGILWTPSIEITRPKGIFTNHSVMPSIDPSKLDSKLASNLIQEHSADTTKVIKLAAGGDGSGGSSGNGGGSGFACFLSESDAQVARSARNEGRALPRKLVSKIVVLQTLEVTEYDMGLLFFFPALENETALAYLHRILQSKLAPFAPLFVEKILDILDHRLGFVDPNQSKSFVPQKPVLDTGSLRTGPGTGCSLVQLASREAQKSTDATIKVKINIDPDLWKILGTNEVMPTPHANILNQAALLLHEAIYVLAYSVGQTDSQQVRGLVATLLSDELYEKLNEANLLQLTTSNEKMGGGSFEFAGLLYATGLFDFSLFEVNEVTPRFLEVHSALLDYMKLLRSRMNASNLTQEARTKYYEWLNKETQTSPSLAFARVAYLAQAQSVIQDIFRLNSNLDDFQKTFAEVCTYAKELTNLDLQNSTERELDLLALKYCEREN